MAETDFDEATLDFLRTIRPTIGEQSIWDKHHLCFPTSKDGLYACYVDSADSPKYVAKDEIGGYPWIGINSYWGENEDDGLKDNYKGVNHKGVAFVVYDMSGPIEEGKKIELAPTIACQYEKTIHYFYRLKDFFPWGKKASVRSKKFFIHVMDVFDSAAGGSYIFNSPVLNPFCPDVTVLWSNDTVFTLKDLQSVDKPTVEEIKKRREHGKKKQADAGRDSAIKKNDRSIKQICTTIMEMKIQGLDPNNKTRVSELSGVARRTVQRNWLQGAIQDLL